MATPKTAASVSGSSCTFKNYYAVFVNYYIIQIHFQPLHKDATRANADKARPGTPWQLLSQSTDCMNMKI
jgi:hypothetical protein